MDFLAAMRVFVRVVERGGMSAAARDLGMGQPAVSERIDKLEQALGQRLLLRNTRATTPTDAGLRFYESSKLALAAAEDARASVRPDPRDLSGTLRVAAPQAVGEVLLPPILMDLRARHPRLRIDLVLNDLVVDPVTEGVDLSLRLGAPGEGAFVARPLGQVRRLLVASPDYLAAHGAPAAPRDLADHPFVRVAGLFDDGRLDLIAPGGKPQRTPVSIAVTVSHWRGVLAFLLAGAGIGVLQAPACAREIADGRLVPLLDDHEVPAFDLHALYPAARPIPPKTRALLDLLEAGLPPLR